MVKKKLRIPLDFSKFGAKLTAETATIDSFNKKVKL